MSSVASSSSKHPPSLPPRRRTNAFLLGQPGFHGQHGDPLPWCTPDDLHGNRHLAFRKGTRRARSVFLPNLGDASCWTRSWPARLFHEVRSSIPNVEAVPIPTPSLSRLCRHFTDQEKTNRFALLVAPDNAAGVSLRREDSGPAPIRAELWMYAALIHPGISVVHTPVGNGRTKKGYLHVVQKSGYNPGPATGVILRVGSHAGGPQVELREGDGAYLSYEPGAELRLENDGQGIAEVLLFDLE